ncbi:DUF2381 family protein [Hyalangium gracile]|uniref:DUF2381 family protein n=1 Tax=Hyalangium gracile TaxID=394092 RepID=UPI001CCA82F8|nr:DUF2381 family protein [Hyalangium gracile]
MALLMKWPPLALCLLVASTAAAQAPARQRQDRRAALPTTSAEPIPEVYVAAGNLTTVAFNGPLDRDSLVLDRTRFKWVDVGDHILVLEPFTNLGPGERLVLQVGFKDKALPSKAVLVVLTKAEVMDGKLEVDRRANSPEALLAALAQKEAELEELKARYAGDGPMGLVLSKWLTANMNPIKFSMPQVPPDASGLVATQAIGYPGTFSPLVAIQLRNLAGQSPWLPAQAHIFEPGGARVKVLAMRMKPEHLAPGEEGLLVLETKDTPWKPGKPFSVELVDASGKRRLLLNLMDR